MTRCLALALATLALAAQANPLADIAGGTTTSYSQTTYTYNVGGLPQLSWTASTDASGIAGYRIHRSDGVKALGPQVGESATTTWLDTSAQGGQTYFYYVIAVDNAGYLSPKSGYRKVVLP